ncbi:uncharacterized protein LOC124818660 [Hydra vulgaris]|uniref:uncharacterized protein LOC124818660 n=1 Tax=Hydra vulgaris TaxID=6087 RepID=UPI001F5E60A5|nr:uncharacterized protein LOC124818660 [Hydra vulgaris]
MQRVVHDDLGLVNSKRQLLSEATRAKRRKRSKELLNWFKDHKDVPIVYSDEQIFTVELEPTRYNDRFPGKSRKTVPLELRAIPKRQHPVGVMVWAGVCSDGSKSPLVFVPEGVKVNQVTYVDFIKPDLIPWAKKKFGDDPWAFMQDSAPAHSAKKTVSLKENVPHLWTPDMWPPSSPEINPMDFAIWSVMETKNAAKTHPKLAALRNKLKKIWKNLNPDMMRQCCELVPERLKSVIHPKGGYFEIH